MSFHLWVAGASLVTLLWGGASGQGPPDSPPVTHRMEGTVAFRPEDTPKDTPEGPQPLRALGCPGPTPFLVKNLIEINENA